MRTMTSVGFEHVQLTDTPNSVALQRPKMQLDLGGIAKGFAVDEALSVIRTEGVSIACVNGGGDISVSDAPPGKNGWTIGIAAASEELSDRTLVLSNRSVATSGDLFQSVELNGIRYSHIVDPRTGYGLTNSVAVTVIAQSCAVADGMASAISVLGTKKGIELATARPGVEVMCSEFQQTKGAPIQTSKSIGFSRYELSEAVK